MKLAFIYLVIAAALYGSISTVAKPTLDSIHPILLSSLTYLIIGIVVTCIIKITGHYYNPTKNDLKLIVLISISGAVFGPILYFYGLTFTNASLASILINAEFIFSIILAVSILKERPTRIGYAGIILIFVGWFCWLIISFFNWNETSGNNNICYDIFYIFNLWSYICIAFVR